MLRVAKVCCFLCCAALLLMGRRICSAAEPEVVCPAIQQDDLYRYDETPEPISLILVGNVHQVKKDGERTGLLDVDVERVLYGFTKEGKLRVFERYRRPDGRQILALHTARTSAEAPFGVSYSLPAEEIWSQRPLAQARLDAKVLSAATVFVGRARPWDLNELARATGEKVGPNSAWHWNSWCLVDVEREVFGDKVPADRAIVVELRDQPIRENACGTGEPLIFLVSEVKPGKKEGMAVYKVDAATLPLPVEADVRAALDRREKYPVREIVDRETSDRQRRARNVREVVFAGTVDDAIQLLGSESLSAGTFGARRLVLAEREGIGPITAQIRKQLTKPVLTGGEARQQQNLIRLLAILAAKLAEARQALLDEIGTLIAAIDKGLEPPKWPNDFERSQFREVQALPDANHSLAWLVEGATGSNAGRTRDGDARWGSVEAVDQDGILADEMVQQFAERLVGLRDRQEGVWRRELQLALDLGRVEDRLDIAAAAEANAGRKILLSERAGWIDGSSHVAWSQDGKYLATVDRVGQIYDTTDWTVKSAFALEGSIDAMIFSNDNQSLFICGGGIHRRVDCQTGHVVQDFVGHHDRVARMQLSAVQDVMVTSSFYEDKLLVWKLPEGKVLREIDLVDVACNFALRPDGKVLVHEVDEVTGWHAEDLLGKLPPVAFHAQNVRFTPDGRLFVSERAGNRPNRRGSDLVWRERRNEGDFALLPTAPRDLADPAVAAFRKAEWLTPRALQNPYAGLERWTAPGDKFAVRIVSELDRHEVTSFEVSEWGQWDGDPECLVLSPDGKLLAMGHSGQPVRLFRLPAGERLLPGNTHVGRIETLRFSSDGKMLESIGKDGLMVMWDAATLKFLGRRTVSASKVAAAKSDAAQSTPGELTEDGKRYFAVVSMGDPRVRWFHISITDAATKQRHSEQKIMMPWWPGDDGGLVPGGKYFHVGTQIYDRDTLKMVAGRRFPGVIISSIVFSDDGSRYAIQVHGGRDGPIAVRVQETLSGKTIAYHDVGTAGVRCITLASDGKRLAFLAEDNTLRILPLP